MTYRCVCNAVTAADFEKAAKEASFDDVLTRLAERNRGFAKQCKSRCVVEMRKEWKETRAGSAVAHNQPAAAQLNLS